MAQSWADRMHTKYVDVTVGTKLNFRGRHSEQIVTVDKVTGRFLNLSNGKRVRRSDGHVPGGDIWNRGCIERLTDEVRFRMNKKAAIVKLRVALRDVEDGAFDEQLKSQRLVLSYTIDPLILDVTKL